jgi:GrpB-like predicted nucleotidyltransferase (UPF0157 family)
VALKFLNNTLLNMHMNDKIDKKKYSFYPYDDNYPLYFEKEKSKLVKIFPNSLIEHIGSTAIPGMGGKGIIDIMIVGDFSGKPLIERAGYSFSINGGSEDRLFFSKHNNKYKVHIHLIKPDSPEIAEKIFFKEYLKKNIKLANKYSEIKKEASKIAKGSRQKYQDFKENFIKSVLENIKH